ncbi:hypothetical protein F2P79_016661 [Pimephales promelas]|nr:hypothetical protein F2P79_016661 [Pimephales promelas]
MDYAYTTQNSLGWYKMRNRKQPVLLTPTSGNHAADMNPEAIRNLRGPDILLIDTKASWSYVLHTYSSVTKSSSVTKGSITVRQTPSILCARNGG